MVEFEEFLWDYLIYNRLQAYKGEIHDERKDIQRRTIQSAKIVSK